MIKKEDLKWYFNDALGHIPASTVESWLESLLDDINSGRESPIVYRAGDRLLLALQEEDESWEILDTEVLGWSYGIRPKKISKSATKAIEEKDDEGDRLVQFFFGKKKS